MMPILRVGVKRSGGFSLIEALIVTVLLGLLTVLVSPSLSSVYRGVVLKSTVRSIAGTLRYVRASAIGASEPQLFVINLENREFAIAPPAQKTLNSRTGAHSASQKIGLKIGKNPSQDITREIAKYIHLRVVDEMQFGSAANKQRLAIKFFPNGGSTGGRLLLSHLHNRYLTDVNPFTGKVSVDITRDAEVQTTLRHLAK